MENAPTYNSDPTAWHEALKKEFKTDDIQRFLSRRLLEGTARDLLSTQSSSWAAPHPSAPALSHTWVREPDIAEAKKLLSIGVWDFILDPFLLGWTKDQTKEFQNQWHLPEARLWVVGENVINAERVVHEGGHGVHELAWLLHAIINWAQSANPKEIGVAVSLDREFFKSIAKLRALKAITAAALTELHRDDLLEKITWISRTNWRDFTSFDAASNILRNATAISAGLIAGTHVVESLPHDLLLQKQDQSASHLALATQLILQQESGLGEVADAAHGAHALENLTRALAEEAWKTMQTIAGSDDAWEKLAPAVKASWQDAQKLFRTRKIVQAGVNDFPDPAEKVLLHKRFLQADHVRLGQQFENLRMDMQNLKPLKVALLVVGDYAALQARMNFTKNIFELLGITVVEPGRGLSKTEAIDWAKGMNASVWAWVAADGDTAEASFPTNVRSYSAGKNSQDGFVSLYAGMDVVTELQALLAWWKERP